MRKSKHNQHASFAEPIVTFRWGDGNSVIYAWCQGGSDQFFRGQWMAEDGMSLGKTNVESIELLQYVMADNPTQERQKLFRAHYPSGYRIEWVPMNQVKRHNGLMEAYSRNQAAGKLAAARASGAAPPRAMVGPAS